MWTLPRVAGLIEERTGQRYHPGHVWRVSRKLGLSCRRPTRHAIERDEVAIAHWKHVSWPRLEKTQREGSIVVFIDECGLSTRPHRVRTWARRGQIPVLRETFNRDKLSVIAGLRLWPFYFRIYAGSINGAWAAAIQHALLCHVPGKLLVICDGAATHRSQFVKAVLTASVGRRWLEKPPAYAP